MDALDFGTAWTVSDDSTSSGTDTSSDTQSHIDDVAMQVSQHGGGRSQGQYDPHTRALRDRLLQDAGIVFEVPLPVFEPPSQVGSAETDVKHHDGCLALLRPLGVKVHRLLREAILDKTRSSEEDVTAVRRLLNHLFQRRQVGTMVVEARLVQLPRQTFTRRLMQAAAVAHFGSRLFASSLLSRLLLLVQAGQWRIRVVLTAMGYDETPLPMRSVPAHVGPRGCPDRDDILEEGESVADMVLPCQKERGTMKLLQSEVSLSIVAQQTDTGAQKLIFVPLPCPLAIVDRATGRTLLANQSEQCYLHLLSEIKSHSDYVGDIAMTDNAGANMACEEAAYAQGKDAFRMRSLCAAHRLSSAQGHVFAAVPQCISGIISASLAQRPGGAALVLRKSIASVIARSLRIHIGRLPPADWDPRQQYKRAVLDQFLPADTAASLQRRSALDLMLAGDLQSDAIDLYVSSEEMVPDTAVWCDTLAELLLPSAIPVFARLACDAVAQQGKTEPPHQLLCCLSSGHPQEF